MSDSRRLRIAIQKSGRLSDDSIALLKAIGIKLNIRDRLLIAHSTNENIDLLRVRDDDIPGLVMDGVVDLGFIGENELEEKMLERQAAGKAADFEVLRRLDYGGCRLSIAVPKFNYESVKSLEGKKVATTYPYLLERFFKESGVNAKAVMLTGSVEVAPRAGVADAICDLVSTGATLEANGLQEEEVIFRSKAVLIQRADGEISDEKQALINRLVPRIDGVIQAKESKYIMLHAPKAYLEQVKSLLPGAENPTVLPLAGAEDTVAIHVVSPENLFWETMEKLKALGCSSILVMPIEKMMG